MNMRAYKIATFVLAVLVSVLGWCFFRQSAQVMDGAFVSHQADQLRLDLKDADPTIGRDRLHLLNDLEWYLSYYDAHTNTLAHSAVLRLLWIERNYVVRDTLAYLRKGTTNDFGDDPYEWLKHEYPHTDAR